MLDRAVLRRGRPKPDANRWSITESYKTYTEVPYRLILAESLAWTLPGLLYPKRAGHPRGRLVAFAALNSLSLAAANKALAQNPELIESDGWILRQSVAAWLRYVGYSAVVPKQTYWRGERDNVAFYTQVWWPILLWGAGRGPRWASLAGPLSGYLFYLSSAWANGEALVPPPEVRRNITNYGNTAWRSGVVCAVVFQILRRASEEAVAEREALSARLAAEEEERSIRRQEVSVRNDVTLSLMRVRSLARDLLSPDLAEEISTVIDEVVRKPWSHGEISTGTAFGIVEQAAAECAQQVKICGHDMYLDLISAGAFQAVVYTALDNVRVHSRSTEVVVEINHTNDQIEVHIADDGIGLSSVMPAYEANHALTRAREYMRYLGGDLMISEGCPQGVTVDAWWPHQSQASGGR